MPKDATHWSIRSMATPPGFSHTTIRSLVARRHSMRANTMERALEAIRRRHAHLLANEAQDTESSTLYSGRSATSQFYEIVIITRLVKPLSETGYRQK
jgi:hypothetical protein